jgi:hypothetical protein
MNVSFPQAWHLVSSYLQNLSRQIFYFNSCCAKGFLILLKFLLNIGKSELRMDSGHNLKGVKPQLIILVSNMHGFSAAALP